MLPQRLKQSRKAKKLTQDALAKKVSTKKTSISNYETGYSSPSNEMLKDLADNLGVTTDYLLGRTDDPHQSLSEGTKRFVEAVEIDNDEQAVAALSEFLLYKGEKLPDPTIREILNYARYRLKEEK
ncbi:helix-turn-helix domain-containing protein [Cohnella sp. GCM10020058]|uniref:helix-turn-helix domain-containing protein n=1 Tax=Cohnella sp. GCM10020058 TaxID=3317330 RepID=UPI00363DA9C2